MSVRKRLNFLIWLLILVLPQVSLASVSDLRQEIDAIAENLSPEVGIQIVSLDKKDTLYSKNPKMLLNPASTTKLVTAAAALKLLEPDFTFHTKFYLTPKKDLYVEGSGDPSIIIEELKMITQELMRKGVTNIRHILVNDAYFSSYTQPGLPAEKSYYNSYTGALSLNFNRIMIKVKPGARVGDDANVKADSGEITIPIKNEVETSPRRTRAKIEFIRPPTKEGEELFTVSGRIPIRSKGVTVERHVNLPPLYFAQALGALLEQKGVNVFGEIYSGPEPKGSKLVLDYESKPLSLIVRDMNKFSNNFISEQLVKVLGAKFLKPPGSTAKGITVLKKYLKGLKISPRSYILVNGSGLTYDNRMSAEQLVRIMQDIYSSKKLWISFEDSLSIWGKDGTLKRRKNSALLVGSARAKTGSLDFVKTIAGTVPSANGETVAFAILLNGGSNMAGCREIQRRIIEAVAKFQR